MSTLQTELGDGHQSLGPWLSQVHAFFPFFSSCWLLRCHYCAASVCIARLKTVLFSPSVGWHDSIFSSWPVQVTPEPRSSPLAGRYFSRAWPVEGQACGSGRHFLMLHLVYRWNKWNFGLVEGRWSFLWADGSQELLGHRSCDCLHGHSLCQFWLCQKTFHNGKKYLIHCLELRGCIFILISFWRDSF